jgi:hypothetical protein
MPATTEPAAFADVRVLLWRVADNQGHYWPCELLHAFTLQMAARGLCVSTDMMLGDHVYAREQLAIAHSCGDGRLRDLAVQLFSFFEARDRALAAGSVHH